ncbi:unnamed protein product, partial [Timema podura]|nr:unnamed protein product [Timema podura]
MAVPVIVLDTKGRCNNSNLDLSMDEACFDVRSNALDPLTIWSLSAECEKMGHIIIAMKEIYIFKNMDDMAGIFPAMAALISTILSDLNCPTCVTLVVVFFTFFILTLLSWAAMRILRSEWLANLKQRNVPFSELESVST